MLGFRACKSGQYLSCWMLFRELLICTFIYLWSLNTVLKNLVNSISKSWKSLGNVWRQMPFPLVSSSYTEGGHQIQVAARLAVCVCVLRFYKERIKVSIKSTNSAAPKSVQKLLLTSSIWTVRRTLWEDCILLYWQRWFFLFRNRNILSVTPSVSNKYLTDPSKATGQGNN